MRKALRKPQPGKETGAVLLFMVIMVAILSLYINSLLPKKEASYPERKQKTINELNVLYYAVRDYYTEYKAFPTAGGMLSDTAFIEKFANPGLMVNANGTGGSVYEQWGANSVYYEIAGLVVNDTNRTIKSLGTNMAVGGSDQDADTTAQIYNTLSAKSRTRHLLDIIKAAHIYAATTYSGSTWAGSTNRRGSGSALTPTGGFSLGPEFDTDGWGTAIYNRTTNIISAGPNKTNNAGGSDDIVW